VCVCVCVCARVYGKYNNIKRIIYASPFRLLLLYYIVLFQQNILYDITKYIK
jgi:hypothetical protein